MLQILAIIALIGVAIDATRTVNRDRTVFAEFGQTTATRWLVWLYPLPPILMMFIPASAHVICLPPICILCFGPAISIATINKRRFECAGTDRVDRAQRSADHVAMTGMLASGVLIGTAVIFWVLNR
jgi:hypothetical protein